MRLRRSLAILSVLLLLTGLLSPVALAASGGQRNITADEAVAYLKRFGIVRGDPDGNLRLNDPITRAELVKILVAALGQEQQAQVLTGAVAFPDTANHWASGYIAVAKMSNLASGYPDGTFKPQNNVTNAEVLAFLTRAVGVAEDPSLPWPDKVIQPAIQQGIVPPELDIRLVADFPATRAGVFLFAHRAFLLVKGSDGKNLYQRYWDKEAPALTLNDVPEVTSAAQVTVSGRATGAREVLVNGSAVALLADGSFSSVVDLQVGTNEITVVAVDDVGNTTTETLTVARSGGEPAEIEAPASLTFKVGESRRLDVTVKDANGIAIPNAEITAEVSDDLGTFDPETMTFTAGDKTGVGTLTLRAGEATARITVTVTAGDVVKVVVTPEKESVAPGEQVKVTAKAYDAAGNEITGLPALFSVTGTGALIHPQTGEFAAYREGVYTVRATIGTVTGEAKVGVYGDPVDLVIEGPSTVVGNGQATEPFRVKVVDRNGTLVADDEERVVQLESDVFGLEFVDAEGNPLVNDELTLKNGEATFYVKADASLWGVVVEITATDEEDEDFSDSISVEVLEQEPVAVAVVRQDEYLAANASSTASVYLAVVDQSGVEMLDGAWDIDWRIDGPAVEDETEDDRGTVTYYGGEGPVELVLRSITGEIGTVTVTATADGLKSATAKLQATVVGRPSQLKVTVDKAEQRVGADFAESAGVKVTVTVTDSKGVPVSYDGEVVVSFSHGFEEYEAADESDSDIDAEDTNLKDDLPYDRIVLEFDRESRRSFRFVTTKAGEFTLTATASGLTSASAKTTFKAGPATRAGFTTRGTLVAITDLEGQATVQLMDDWGNPVRQAGVSITLQAYKDNSTTNEVVIAGKKGKATLRTDANGQATFSFTVRPDTRADYTIEVDEVEGLEPDAESGTLAITILPVLPDRITVTLHRDVINKTGVTSVEAGSEIIVRAYVEDRYGIGLDFPQLAGHLRLVVPDGAFDVDGDFEGDSAAEVAEWAAEHWAHEGDGYFLLEGLIPVKIGRHTVAVQIDAGGTTKQGSRSINVTAVDPDNADHVIVKEAEDIDSSGGTIRVKEGQATKITLEVVNENNFPVKSGKFKVYFSSDDEIYVRETATGISKKELDIGVTKTVYLVAGEDGELRIELDDGDEWILTVDVE
ncbi:MAG: S-layer homology domain-containing protein [Firmicutes bacterium]|nr:S-layer homology domain-containing protein [Bacillota bacterium]